MNWEDVLKLQAYSGTCPKCGTFRPREGTSVCPIKDPQCPMETKKKTSLIDRARQANREDPRMGRR